MYSRIIGTGSYLPEKIMTNKEIETLVDTSDEWIQARTGIKQRHIVAPEQACSDLAEQAALRAIEAAAIENNDIDLIIVATTTPDMIFPSTACHVQKKLGIQGCPAFDIQAVCTGFIYALTVADQFIKTGAANNVLVVGSEIFSRILDWSDRGTCILFGDGAGAVVVSASDEPGIYGSKIHADGDYQHLLNVPVSPAAPDAIREAEATTVRMEGNEVFKKAVITLGAIAEEVLTSNNMDKSDIDWLIPHQANRRIISATAKKLELPMEKVVMTVAQHGNTSAASVPLALDQAVRDGRIQKGDTLLLEGFGGGFTWGANLVRF